MLTISLYLHCIHLFAEGERERAEGGGEEPESEIENDFLWIAAFLATDDVNEPRRGRCSVMDRKRLRGEKPRARRDRH